MKKVIERMTCEIKRDGKWETTYTLTEFDERGKENIYKSLMCQLVAKKLHKCTNIIRFTDSCNYDGTRTITVYYDNAMKYTYVVRV